jgi:archaellum component FlaC
MGEMTDREFLSAMLERMNEIGADVTAIKDRVDSIDRRLGNVEDRFTGVENRLIKVEDTLQEVKQVQIQQGEQIAGIAVTMMEHAASIRTLKLVK